MNNEIINDAVARFIFYMVSIGGISLVIYFARKKEKKKSDIMVSVSNRKSDLVQSYFFEPILNKGVKRLIIAMGFLIPLLIAMIICYNDARVTENDYGETLRFYDDSVFFGSLFLTFISYWILYLIIIWVYKGFQESKRM